MKMKLTNDEEIILNDLMEFDKKYLCEWIVTDMTEKRKQEYLTNLKESDIENE